MKLFAIVQSLIEVLFAWLQFIAAGYYPVIDEEGLWFKFNPLSRSMMSPWENYKREEEWRNYCASVIGE